MVRRPTNHWMTELGFRWKLSWTYRPLWFTLPDCCSHASWSSFSLKMGWFVILRVFSPWGLEAPSPEGLCLSLHPLTGSVSVPRWITILHSPAVWNDCWCVFQMKISYTPGWCHLVTRFTGHVDIFRSAVYCAYVLIYAKHLEKCPANNMCHRKVRVIIIIIIISITITIII